MQVKDILKLSCQFLDKDDLAQKFDSNDALDEDEEKVVCELENCLNLVREEIATEILPIVKIDKLKTDNFKIPFNEFSFAPVSILAVKDGCGRGVKHKVFDDYLVALAGEVEVWYSACPEKVARDDEFASTLPERVYAYGVLREFFIKKGLFKDAEIWEERFKHSLELLSRKKSSVKIAGRRWI